MYLVVVNNEDFTYKCFALVAVSKMYLIVAMKKEQNLIKQIKMV